MYVDFVFILKQNLWKLEAFSLWQDFFLVTLWQKTLKDSFVPKDRLCFHWVTLWISKLGRAQNILDALPFLEQQPEVKQSPRASQCHYLGTAKLGLLCCTYAYLNTVRMYSCQTHSVPLKLLCHAWRKHLYARKKSFFPLQELLHSSFSERYILKCTVQQVISVWSQFILSSFFKLPAGLNEPLFQWNPRPAELCEHFATMQI